MSNATPNSPKVKESVALSGVPAGNTAICTVGHSGNDLLYRGYEIHDLASHATCEEVAHLLIHGHLPNRAELDAYRARLISFRGLSEPVRSILEKLPAKSHPMGVLRTGCSAIGAIHPEQAPAGSAMPTDFFAARNRRPARRIDSRHALLLASLRDQRPTDRRRDRRTHARRPHPPAAAPAHALRSAHKGAGPLAHPLSGA
jgi:citrate synthase